MAHNASTEEEIIQPSLGDAGKNLATVLTSSPNLRAKLFANPTKTVGKQLPPRKYWDYRIDPHLLFVHPVRFVVQRHRYRAALATQTLEEIANRIDGARLTSAVNTDAVFEDFFGPIVRVSQRTFNGVFALSVLAFVVACGLIGAGVYIAVYPPAEGSSTVLGSVFGGTGAVAALGSAYAMAIGGITAEARRNARLRLVLTGFATQLGQLGDSGHQLRDLRRNECCAAPDSGGGRFREGRKQTGPEGRPTARQRRGGLAARAREWSQRDSNP